MSKDTDITSSEETKNGKKYNAQPEHRSEKTFTIQSPLGMLQQNYKRGETYSTQNLLDISQPEYKGESTFTIQKSTELHQSMHRDEHTFTIQKQWEMSMNSNRAILKIQNHGVAIDSVVPSTNLTVFHSLVENKTLSHVVITKNLSNTIPKILLLEQEHCRLLMAKISLEVIKYFNSTKTKINCLLREIKEITATPVMAHSQNLNLDITKLKKALQHTSFILNELVKNAEKLIIKVEKILPIITKSAPRNSVTSEFIKSKNYTKQYTVFCYRITHTIDKLASLLLPTQVKSYCDDFSFTKMLWTSKILKDKTIELTEIFCTCFQEKTHFYPDDMYTKQKTFGYKLSYNFVLLQPAKFDNKNISVCNNTESNVDINSVSSYILEISKMRSYSITPKLCTVTLKALKETMEESPTTNNNPKLQTPYSKFVLKRVKTFFKRLLESENKYIDTLLEELQHTNDDILRGNTNALYRKFKKSSQHDNVNSAKRHQRIVQWDSNLVPALKDYLFGTYMETLWSNVKKTIRIYYVQSIFSTYSEICRIDDLALSYQEQELLWQVQTILTRKGNSPKRFVDILRTLSISISEFHNKQRFDQGLMQSMGLLLKDRFRYVEGSNTVMPSSSTLSAFLKCQVFLQEQYKCLQRSGEFSQNNMNGVLLNNNGSTSLLHQLVTLHLFLKTSLLSKRQQFLSSATWEQFFVITTSDVKIIFSPCQKLLIRLTDGLKESSMFPSECNILDEQTQFLEVFEKNSMKMMAKQIRNRSRAVWKEHMTQSKLWKRRGSKIQVYSPNSYIKVAIQIIFAPILDCFHVLTQEQKSNVTCKCISAFVRTWMEHILEERIIFSRHGAQQLDFDFSHFINWFESEEFGLSLDEIAEIYSLSVLSDMKNAIILLACQPDDRKNGSSGSEETNLLSNNFGSSSSVASQVSIESFHGSQFDDVIKQIDIQNKEQWLALRAKGGQSKRFLCIS